MVSDMHPSFSLEQKFIPFRPLGLTLYFSRPQIRQSLLANRQHNATWIEGTAKRRIEDLMSCTVVTL
jgi:hypothetical protein